MVAAQTDGNRKDARVAASWAFLNRMLQSRGLRGFTVGRDGLPPPLQVVSTVSFLLREAEAKHHTNQASNHAERVTGCSSAVPISVHMPERDTADSKAVDSQGTSCRRDKLAKEMEELLEKQIDLLARLNSAIEQTLMTTEERIKCKDSMAGEQQRPPSTSSKAGSMSTGVVRNQDFGIMDSRPGLLSHIDPNNAWADAEKSAAQSPHSAGCADAYMAKLDGLLLQLQAEKGAHRRLHDGMLESKVRPGDSETGEDSTAAAEEQPLLGVTADENIKGYGHADDDLIVLRKCLHRCCTIAFRSGCAFLPGSDGDEEGMLSPSGPEDLAPVLEHWLRELKRLAGLEDLVSDISTLLVTAGCEEGGSVEVEERCCFPGVIDRSEILARLRRLRYLAEDAKAASGVIASAQLAERAGGPSMLPMQLVKHFQLLFDCPRLGGVLACMNKVHVDIQAARNFKKAVASVLGIGEDDKWSEAAMIAEIEDIVAGGGQPAYW